MNTASLLVLSSCSLLSPESKQSRSLPIITDPEIRITTDSLAEFLSEVSLFQLLPSFQNLGDRQLETIFLVGAGEHGKEAGAEGRLL